MLGHTGVVTTRPRCGGVFRLFFETCGFSRCFVSPKQNMPTRPRAVCFAEAKHPACYTRAPCLLCFAVAETSGIEVRVLFHFDPLCFESCPNPSERSIRKIAEKAKSLCALLGARAYCHSYTHQTSLSCSYFPHKRHRCQGSISLLYWP